VAFFFLFPSDEVKPYSLSTGTCGMFLSVVDKVYGGRLVY
jgi:hypothetical protein